MKIGDLVRFKEPEQRTEGEHGVIIDDSPRDLPAHVQVLWPNNNRILERKIFLEALNEKR